MLFHIIMYICVQIFCGFLCIFGVLLHAVHNLHNFITFILKSAVKDST